MSIKKQIKNKLKSNFPNLFLTYLSYKSKQGYREMQQKVTKMGFTFMGMQSMLDGTFEPEETNIILDSLKKTDVFIDIGANNGYFSCIANHQGVKTISIEPLPENLNILFSNLQINNWNEAEIFPVGLGEKPMIIDLYGENTGASVLSNWAGNSTLIKRSIAISTLDIILGNRFLEENIFIKLDVEGYEFEVIKGAKLTLTRIPKPIWLIEICFTEHFNEGINPNYLNIFDLFWKNDYKAYTADTDQRIVIKEDVLRWIKNKKRDFGYANFIFK
jgi:FkbM family methyltransferase